MEKHEIIASLRNDLRAVMNDRGYVIAQRIQTYEKTGGFRHHHCATLDGNSRQSLCREKDPFKMGSQES